MNPIKPGIMLLILIFIIGSAQSSVLTVGNKDANYASIQMAIDEARPQDIIEVKEGIYNEKVTVDIALVLRGINRPVIDSMGKDSPLSLTCGGTVIEGFNLRNSSKYGSGINMILDPFYILNRRDINTSGITIRNNIISYNYEGIAIKELSDNIIERNVIINNRNTGLNLINSWHNKLDGNIMVNNSNGISLKASSENVIEDNSLINNSGNGISLGNYYLTEYGPYGFSDNNTIRRNELENNGKGISLLYAEGNNISYNKVIDNRYGIYLDGSPNNSIFNNEYVNNTINTVSGNQSRDEIIDESRNQKQFTGNFYHLLFNALFFEAALALLFTICMGLIMGIVAGLIVEKALMSQSLSLIGNAVIGMIGFNIGFYAGLLLASDLSIAFIMAVLVSIISIFLISKLKSKCHDNAG